MQFWGKTNDTETAHYASELSGVVRVQFRNYEHHGAERAWKQFWSAEGAPYQLADRNRSGLMTEHIHGVPKGWWYVYSGEPTSIVLCIPALMYQWQDEVLPPPTGKAYMLAVPKNTAEPRANGASTQDDSQSGGEGPAAAEPPEQPSSEGESSSPPTSDGRSCSGCGSPVSKAARFCESCGGRL